MRSQSKATPSKRRRSKRGRGRKKTARAASAPASAWSGELQPGTVVGDYEVGKVLGRGGLAVVYQARHQVLHTEHALKVPSRTDAHYLKRLLLEGRAQARLRHDHIVRVTGLTNHNGLPILVMDHVDGYTLSQSLQQRPFTLAECDRVAMHLLDAVAHTHANEMVHRDIKPANILIAREGGEPSAFLTDFGLVRNVGQPYRPRTLQGLTQDHTLLGTPAYMAPEQIDDAHSVSQHADVWSLGCVLYELVCGAPPFCQAKRLDLFQQIHSGVYKPLQQRRPGIPARFVRTVERCLQRDPNQRPADAAAVFASWKGRGARRRWTQSTRNMPLISPPSLPPTVAALS